jgi:hypothetical protein
MLCSSSALSGDSGVGVVELSDVVIRNISMGLMDLKLVRDSRYTVLEYRFSLEFVTIILIL